MVTQRAWYSCPQSNIRQENYNRNNTRLLCKHTFKTSSLAFFYIAVSEGFHIPQGCVCITSNISRIKSNLAACLPYFSPGTELKVGWSDEEGSGYREETCLSRWSRIQSWRAGVSSISSRLPGARAVYIGSQITKTQLCHPRQCYIRCTVPLPQLLIVKSLEPLEICPRNKEMKCS